MDAINGPKGSKEFKDEIRRRGAALQVLLDEEETMRKDRRNKSQAKNVLWLTLNDGERFLSGHPWWSWLYTQKTSNYVRLKKEAEEAEEALAAATKRCEENAGELRVFVDNALPDFDPEFSARIDVLNSLVCVSFNAQALIRMLDDYLKEGQPEKLTLGLQTILDTAATAVAEVVKDRNAKIQTFASIKSMVDFTKELSLGDIFEILSETSDECSARSKFYRLNKRIKALTEDVERRVAVLEEDIRCYRSAYLEAVAKETPDGQTAPAGEQ